MKRSARPLSAVLLALSLVTVLTTSLRLSPERNNASAQYRTNGGWLIGYSAPDNGGSVGP